MLNIYSLLTCLLAIGLSSCIYGTRVGIHNKSTEDKTIQVHYPAGFRFPLQGMNKDSLPGYDHTLTGNAVTSYDHYRYPVRLPIVALDTVARTYSFTLKAKHEVVLQE